MIDEELRGI